MKKIIFAKICESPYVFVRYSTLNVIPTYADTTLGKSGEKCNDYLIVCKVNLRPNYAASTVFLISKHTNVTSNG
jgi:hypothetical protein